MVKVTIGLFQREVISMLSNFNSLQKLNQMSGLKCRAVFLTDNKCSLAHVRKCQFCAFNESTDNSRGFRYIYRLTCIMFGHVPTDVLLQFIRNEDLFSMKSIKVLLMLSIYCCLILANYHES